MGDRQEGIVADVAWGARGQQFPAGVLGLNVYSGPAWPGLAQLGAWGLPYMVGFESATTRAYGGAPAAEPDALSLVDRIRSIPGYVEAGASVWWCAADSPSTPDWAVAQIEGYGQRFAEIVAAEIGVRGEYPYGNAIAAGAGVRGVRAAGAPADRWGVGTWGEGEGGGAFMLPGSSDAALLQSGNTPGPIPGDTDYNALYVPFSGLGMMGGPSPTPEPTRPPTHGSDTMLAVATSDGQYGKAKRNNFYLVTPGTSYVPFMPGADIGDLAAKAGSLWPAAQIDGGQLEVWWGQAQDFEKLLAGGVLGGVPAPGPDLGPARAALADAGAALNTASVAIKAAVDRLP